MLNLKRLMEAHQLKIGVVAGRCGISRTTLSLIANEGRWPNKDMAKRYRLQDLLRGALVALGVAVNDLNEVFEVVRECESAQMSTPGPDAEPAEAVESKADTTEGEPMLLKKQPLAQATRRAFNLFRDPFVEDVNAAEDLYLTPDMRYVAEAMLATARFGGMLAVVAESGGGKTTLRRAMLDRINREQLPILVVEPYIVAMEENDQKGKTLKSQHIAEAVITDLLPLASIKSSPQARFKQMHNALKDAARAGQRVVLVVEEAHCLPVPTLKHLKRFVELEDGFKKLLSVILIGQPELATRLSERNPEVREVVQRCEIAFLTPMDAAVPDYVKHKFSRIGAKAEDLFEAEALEALRSRLTVSPQPTKGGGRTSAVSLCYPLAVNNLATAALNYAAKIGAAKVTAEIVREC